MNSTEPQKSQKAQPQNTALHSFQKTLCAICAVLCAVVLCTVDTSGASKMLCTIEVPPAVSQAIQPLHTHKAFGPVAYVLACDNRYQATKLLVMLLVLFVLCIAWELFVHVVRPVYLVLKCSFAGAGAPSYVHNNPQSQYTPMPSYHADTVHLIVTSRFPSEEKARIYDKIISEAFATSHLEKIRRQYSVPIQAILSSQSPDHAWANMELLVAVTISLGAAPKPPSSEHFRLPSRRQLFPQTWALDDLVSSEFKQCLFRAALTVMVDNVYGEEGVKQTAIACALYSCALACIKAATDTEPSPAEDLSLKNAVVALSKSIARIMSSGLQEGMYLKYEMTNQNTTHPEIRILSIHTFVAGKIRSLKIRHGQTPPVLYCTTTMDAPLRGLHDVEEKYKCTFHETNIPAPPTLYVIDTDFI